MNLSRQLEEAFGKPAAEIGDERKWKAGTFVKTAQGWVQKVARGAKEKGAEAAKSAKAAPGEAKKIATDSAYRSEVGKQIGDAIRRKSKKTAEHIVDELKELHGAGVALKKLGLKQELDGHDKKALKAAAKIIATTVAGTVVIGGLSHLTVGALAHHFVVETLLKSAGRAALFASIVRRGGWALLEQGEAEQVQGLVNQIVKHVAQRFENLGSMSDEEIQSILSKEG